MDDARDHVHEAQPPVTEHAAPLAREPSPLAGLQTGMGNRAFGAMLSRAIVAREYTEAPPFELPEWEGGEGELGMEGADEEPVPLQQATGSSGAGAGNKFTRPAPTDLSQTFADAQAALAHMNAKGTYIGEAKAQFEAHAGKIEVTGKTGAHTASIAVTWSTAASSSMEIWNPSWPNMTADDKAAVAKMRAALLAHEIGHFEVMEKTVGGFTRIEGTGATPKAAVADLKKKAPTVQADWQKALKKADDDYDTKTDHGRNQSAVGGTNVKLELKLGSPPATP